MATTIGRMTAEEFARLPRDGRRYRLVRGEVIAMSPGNKQHGQIAMRLSIPLGAWIYAHDLGEVYAAETGFLLATNPDTIRAAELAYATRARADMAASAPGPWWPGAPDLVAEVVSPHDTDNEVTTKVGEWLAAGTQVVLVIDPAPHSVTVHRPGAAPVVLGEGDTLELPDLFPGWSLPVAALFARFPVTRNA